jgi:alcohol dehydrogenase class IV
MWAPRSDPIDRSLALDGLRALRIGLPLVVDDPMELPGREQTLYGAYLAAVAFASAGAGLHNKICHVLGGMFGLPHAETHAVVLPHVLALNAPAVPDVERRVARALGTESALRGLLELRRELGAPRSLSELGLGADDVPAAVQPVLDAAPPDNPTPVTAENVLALLRAAWAGEDPA